MHIIHETGKGKVILRGKVEIKGNNILITELPYQVYVEPFIDDIKKLIKEGTLTGIDDILNKSDKKRLLVEISCTENPEQVLKMLYAKTDLQKNFNANQFALVGATARMQSAKGAHIFDLQGQACLIGINGFMLCTMVLEYPLNILHGGNSSDIAQKYHHTQHAFSQIKQHGITSSFSSDAQIIGYRHRDNIGEVILTLRIAVGESTEPIN